MSSIHLIRRMALFGALLAAPAVVHAVPVTSSTISFDQTSEVIVTFEGYSALYTSQLFLQLGDGSLGPIFTNKTTTIGTSLSLGTFAAGVELVFKLLVLDTGLEFFTGAAERNSDGIKHATVDADGSMRWVGFEDLKNGGDKDFNDFQFSVTGRAVPPPQPVPDAGATVALMTLGLGTILLARRRLR